jgi:S-adenosylmethionine-diacylglycerol 3-amino-3-carboxypropyl transferase
MNSIKNRAKFDFIRYANCWEDPELLLNALFPLENQVVLSIASAGDNSFSLLTQSPKKVIAVDFNPAQIACVDLRKAAFLNLSYQEVLSFLGISESLYRNEVYQQLRPFLSNESREFWDTNPDGIQQGVIHYGKFERYLKLFGTRLLPLIHGKKKVTELLAQKSQSEQQRFYDKEWDTFLWRALFKVFFSKKVMGKAGRDEQFFAYMESSPSAMILKRTRHALSNIPTHSNPYLRYILTGNFNQSLPHYLREENFEIIRKNLDRLELKQIGVLEAMNLYPNEITRFNLSDIFEYMSHDEFKNSSQQLFEQSGAETKVAYWNLLAHRNMGDFPNFWVTDIEQSERWHKADKAWFYSNFFLSEKKYA